MRLLLENVRVRAADGESERTLLAVDRFTLASGERLGLRGASGSGKTTFLKAISGILRAEGSVLWDDTDLSRLSEAERDAWRGANVGFLFQDGESRQTQRARRDDGAYGSRRGTPKHPHRRDARPGNARDAPARRLD